MQMMSSVGEPYVKTLEDKCRSFSNLALFEKDYIWTKCGKLFQLPFPNNFMEVTIFEKKSNDVTFCLFNPMDTFLNKINIIYSSYLW